MIDHSYYDKPASKWTVSDIQQFAGAEEGPYMEFKKASEFIRDQSFSKEKLASELTETVSAFLNSDGGVILIGVQTDKVQGEKKIELMKSISDWSLDQTLEKLNVSLSVSQIRDLIYGNILPKPSGIEVNAVKITFNNNVTSVFVVTVPRSPLGAHQSAKTLRYYRRTSDGDEPMLDFEIRDVNNRRAGPFLYLQCAVQNTRGMIYDDDWKTSSTEMNQVEHQGTTFYQIELTFMVSNLGHGTADIVELDVGIPQPWILHRYSPKGTNLGAHWEPKNLLSSVIGERVTVFWIPVACDDKYLKFMVRPPVMAQKVYWQAVIYNSNVPPAHPIWPMAGRVPVGELELQLEENQASDIKYWLPWRMLAEDMPETRGAVFMTSESNSLRLYNFQLDEVNWWGEAEELQRFEELKRRFRIS